MNYQTELDLANDGFALTPNVWHTGSGDGKVFEKIVDNVRVYYGVAPDGSVTKLDFTSVAGTVAPAPAEAVPVVDVKAPEDEQAEAEEEKAPEEHTEE